MAEQKKRLSLSSVRSDAKELIWSHRYRLALGMLLMIVNRLVGLVLPASSKYLIDDVIIKHRSELLVPLALAAGGATVVQADAQERAGTHRASPHTLFRFNADRHTHLAHHD